MEQKPNIQPPGPPSDEPASPTPEASALVDNAGNPLRPTHPDHGPMHLIPRQEDGRIATYYYCSKAELYDMQVPAPPPRRQRRDGFTAERQEQFLEHVRGGASGREAARKIGISHTTAYNLYNSPDGAAFRTAWDEAARVTDIVLEDTAFDRAVNGQEEIVFHQGQRVGTRWKYDNNLLMKLLRARNPLKYAPLSEIEGWLRHRGIAAPADVDGALDRLSAAEAEWGRRLPGEEGPAQLAGRGDGAAPFGPAERVETSARPDALSSVRPEPVEGPSPTSEQDSGLSIGSDPAEEDSVDTPDASTSSTSPDTGQAEVRDDPSTSSTSPDSGQAEVRDDPSTSSTSPDSGQEAARMPPVPDPPELESPPNLFRPPPRPRIVML